jgi:hypothetical protein
MMDLLTPTDHAGAYEWASVFLAHMAIGLALVALVSAVLDWIAGDWMDGVGEVAALIVSVVYLVAWEGFVQRYGAGLMDAAVDTFAVASGGLLGLFLWRRAGVRAAGVLALAGLALWRGVRGRR